MGTLEEFKFSSEDMPEWKLSDSAFEASEQIVAFTLGYLFS